MSIMQTAKEDGTARGATHYQRLQQQPIEVMQSIMSKERMLGFCEGNVLKYALRLGAKDEDIKEMRKIAEYSKWFVVVAEDKTIDPREEGSGKDCEQ